MKKKHVWKTNGSIFTMPFENVIVQEWDTNNKAAAMKEIEEILTMKVGPRCPDNEIYWEVNDYCNTLDFNAPYNVLFAACKKKFGNVQNIDSIINTVLD